VLCGGRYETGFWTEYNYNDVWVSTNSGETWSCQSTDTVWDPRSFHSMVCLPDDSIIVTCGILYETAFVQSFYNDVWISPNAGGSWTRMMESFGGDARWGAATTSLLDGTVILTGGLVGVPDRETLYDDVWAIF
jgi:hypothetical protein